jgi:nitroimidazol reductase NimA-like FMN-containing flavoprotein (pyridoxamine 5'-phosphate oxidase superfamily)
LRRKEKEIRSKEEVESVIQKALVCRLGMADENGPYIVPLSFGYRDGFLFFHSAKEGKKIDILRKNKKVCFEIDTDHEIVESEKACKWGMEYKSVIGFGNAFIIEDIESIKAALDVIMDHYSGRTFEYQDEVLRKTVVIKVEIESMTGKKSEW